MLAAAEVRGGASRLATSLTCSRCANRDADARGGDIGLLLTPRVGKGVPQGLSAVCFIDVMTLNVMTAERYLLCGVVVLLDPWPQPQSFHLASRTSASQ